MKIFSSHLTYFLMKQFVHNYQHHHPFGDYCSTSSVLLCQLSRTDFHSKDYLCICPFLHCDMCHVWWLAFRISSLKVSSTWREEDTHLKVLYPSLIPKQTICQKMSSLQNMLIRSIHKTGAFTQDYCNTQYTLWAHILVGIAKFHTLSNLLWTLGTMCLWTQWLYHIRNSIYL